MSDLSKSIRELPPEQQALRAKCFHPTGTFIGFEKEEIERSIPERFEKIVRMYPDRIAVKAGSQVVTYAELNAMANRLARAILTRQGNHAEPIALLFEKGPAQVAAMLGVLKTGSFFAVLDPSFPRARLEAVLKDFPARLIVADRQYLSLAQGLTGPGCRVMEFEAVGHDLSIENLQLSISPKAIAHVGYTSGSTGRPKGVVRDHRAYLHFIMLYTKAYHNCEQDRLSLLASGTGRAMNDTFTTLLNGGALLLFDVRNGGVSRLAEWIYEERISIFSVSAPLFRNFCKGLTGNERFPELRLIRLGSQAAYEDDVDLYKAFFPPGCLLANGLTTQESGFLSTYLLDHHTEVSGAEVPVGYPVEDKEVFLLDDDGREVGFNEVGEIVVRSRYLSPGYWRWPDLTDAKFKPDPDDPETRRYYTGDLGLMRPDGCLVHKGRKDFRVKIRGYGVEMAEVEKTLRSHAGVNETTVVARQNSVGEASLVAYFTASGERGPSVSELRRFLSERVPDYMIPSAFVRLEALPLTPHGKVDRNALPAPAPSRPELEAPFIAPRTAVEERLATVWAQVLGRDGIGIHDNFFDLGGQSLSGASLVSQLQREFQVELPLRVLFESPTIAQLTARIEIEQENKSQAGGTGWTYLFELQPGQDRTPVFFFPGGGGGEPEFFIYAGLARQVGPEYPFYGLRVRGADGVSAPHRSVEAMAADYLEEIRSRQPEGPYYLVGECAGGASAYEAARQLQAQGQKVAMLVLMDVERPTLGKYLGFRVDRFFRPATTWWKEHVRVSRLPFHWRQVRGLGWRERAHYVIDRLTKAPGRPADSFRVRADAVLEADTSGKAFQRLRWIRESYRRTVRRYRPEPYDGRVEILASERPHRRDPTLDWNELALKGVRAHALPGDHLTYIREHVRVAATQLRECLEKAEANN